MWLCGDIAAPVHLAGSETMVPGLVFDLSCGREEGFVRERGEPVIWSERLKIDRSPSKMKRAVLCVIAHLCPAGPAETKLAVFEGFECGSAA